LIASGMNGQNFAFNGYLPIDKAERVKKIKQLESRALSEKQTQIFMETPYRNLGLVEDVIKNCSQQIFFSIASNIGESNAYIKTKSIQDWKKIPLPDIHKKPTIFSLGLS